MKKPLNLFSFSMMISLLSCAATGCWHSEVYDTYVDSNKINSCELGDIQQLVIIDGSNNEIFCTETEHTNKLCEEYAHYNVKVCPKKYTCDMYKEKDSDDSDKKVISCIKCPDGMEWVNGICQTYTCPESFGDCDLNTRNGCETYLADSIKNCGECGKTCESNQYCYDGQCINSCDLGNENNKICEIGDEKFCVNIKTNKNHCNDCNNKCGEGQVCIAGECKFPCDGFMCGDVCVNANGHAISCEDDGKTLQCGSSYADCDGNLINGCETNINNDHDHCGSCDNSKCGDNEYCSSGTCTNKGQCPSGQLQCHCEQSDDGRVTCIETDDTSQSFQCFDPKSNDFCDAKSCSDLGQTCEGVTFCDNGKCICPKDGRFKQIGEGTKEKPAKCIDMFDKKTCGGSKVCGDDQICNGTDCVCPSGSVKCGEKCIDVLEDPNNCGGCGHKCSTDGEGGKCINGICECNEGYAKCDNNAHWTCVTVKGSSANNYCGAKGTCNEKDDTSDNWYGQQCPNYAPCNNESKCACSEPYIACNEECLDPKAINHCGISGCEKGQEGDDCTKYDADYNPNITSPGDAFCDIKTLKCQCKNDFVINPETNRCTDSMNDPNYCGFGGQYKQCDDGEVCIKGVCQSHCTETGTVNCNGYCINLEDNNMRLNSEGQCVCKVQGAKKLCPNLPSTIPGWVTAGCNTNTYVNDSSNNNCGECFNSCEYGKICDTSGNCICPENEETCTYEAGEYNNNIESIEFCASKNETLHITGCKQCADGWGNADEDWSNGCEANLNEDVLNCGEVGNNCNKTLQNALGISCEKGTCVYTTCSPNYIDCNDTIDLDNTSLPHDGCEQPSISIKACGSCLNQCPETLLACEFNNNAPRCCNSNKVVKGDNILNKEDCCNELKLWKRSLVFATNEYICASEQPDSSLTCSMGFLCVDWKEVK